MGGTHWPIESVGAPIGRPPTWRSNAFSGKGFFTDKRARASNARPYKSFWQPDRCIVAVADYVDRHRRRGEGEEKIRRQLSDQSGTRFDPACVQAMLEIM